MNAMTRREQILDEALRLIGQRGYYGFGINELAQRCQLTKAGLLHHFGTKDKLLTDLVEERDRQSSVEVSGLLAPILRGRPTEILSREEVLEVFHAMVLRNSTQPELVRFFVKLQAESVNQLHPAYDFFLRRDARVIKAFSGILEPHVPNAVQVARHFKALMHGLEREWLAVDQSFDFVTEWDSAAKYLFPPVGC